jgi:hypothetical protein
VRADRDSTIRGRPALAFTLREMNLQQGFGLLTIEGQHVEPMTVPISRGEFTVDGRTWQL